MKRAALVLAILATTVDASAEERAFIGTAVGIEGVSKGMLGDSAEIAKGLDLPTEDRVPVEIVPHLSFGVAGLGERGGLTIALHGAWYRDSIATRPVSLVELKARRDVVPLTLLFQYETRPEKESHYVIAGGPTLAISRFAESGWFANGTTTKVGAGASLWTGGKFDAGPNVSFTLRLFLQVVWLPTHDPLLHDGGATVAGGLTFGLDFGL